MSVLLLGFTLDILPYLSCHLLSTMDVVKAVQHYVEKMISDVPGMKVLLLDTMTVSVPMALLFINLTCVFRHLLYPLSRHSPIS